MHYCLLVFKNKLPEINLWVPPLTHIKVIAHLIGISTAYFITFPYLQTQFFFQIDVGLIFLFVKNEICTFTACPNGTVTVVFGEKLLLSDYSISTWNIHFFCAAEDYKIHWCNFKNSVPFLILQWWGRRRVKQVYASNGTNLLFTRTFFPSFPGSSLTICSF